MRLSYIVLSVLCAFATVAASVSGSQCEVVGGKKVCQNDEGTRIVQTKAAPRLGQEKGERAADAQESNVEEQDNAEEGSSASEESSAEDNAEVQEDKEKSAFPKNPRMDHSLPIMQTPMKILAPMRMTSMNRRKRLKILAPMRITSMSRRKHF